MKNISALISTHLKCDFKTPITNKQTNIMMRIFLFFWGQMFMSEKAHQYQCFNAQLEFYWSSEVNYISFHSRMKINFQQIKRIYSSKSLFTISCIMLPSFRTFTPFMYVCFLLSFLLKVHCVELLASCCAAPSCHPLLRRVKDSGCEYVHLNICQHSVYRYTISILNKSSHRSLSACNC